ncbi:hypothetical protein Rsub_08241 [Raphidocelis subcapitata]|uniref:PHD-type domain-containing protein n=1 Tax=Raphidocelis subcapitata TaxID=307507 RepID=A0A2V0PFF9_9CHLO|nr:hypothetical protein Rsub_08241 [Raphidocelis subcapitata]|eukprot:GBF95805.1 hypothetical protein Rsub_08241 [Raphidocelis subcapitata]
MGRRQSEAAAARAAAAEPQPPTFAEAIRAGAGAFADARARLHALPAAGEGAVKTHTVEAALREQEARRQGIWPAPAPALKAPSRSKSRSGHAPVETTHPGYRIGVAAYTSPFWGLVEDYFREVTREDVENLLALCGDPEDDEALLVPRLGPSAAQTLDRAKLLAAQCGERAPGGGAAAAAVRRAAAAAGVADPGSCPFDVDVPAAAAGPSGGEAGPSGPAVPAGPRRAGGAGASAGQRRVADALHPLPVVRLAAAFLQLSGRGADDLASGCQLPAAAAQALARGDAEAAAAKLTGKHVGRVLEWLCRECGVAGLEEMRQAVAARAAERAARVKAEPGADAPASQDAGQQAASSQQQLLNGVAAGAGDAKHGAGAGSQPPPLTPAAAPKNQQQQAAQAAAAHEAAARAHAEALEADGEARLQHSELVAARRRAERQLYRHPYTDLLLAMPVPPHLTAAAAATGADDEGLEDGSGAAGGAAGGAEAAAVAGAAPGPPGGSGLAADGGGESGAAAASDATAGAGATPEASTAASGGAASDGPPASSRGTRAGARGRPGRSRGRGRGRGRGGGPGGGPPGASQRAALAKEQQASHPVAVAVREAVAAGGPPGALDEQWARLDAAAPVVAVAPDDEVLAELLALQGELLQQMAANRARVADVVARALEDAPAQREVAAGWRRCEEDMQAYQARLREIKRERIRAKREAERREAAALAAAALPTSPRSGARIKRHDYIVSRHGGDGEWVTDGGGSGGGGGGAEPPGLGSELVDAFAVRGASDDEVCAVCGDGASEAPNVIVFCERCDVAVHQACYGIAEVPEGEWLCWPCSLHEAQLRARGVPQPQIRPPRWATAGAGAPAAALEGGAGSVECALCPVRLGAFKRSREDGRWCHLVCAHHHPEVVVEAGDICDAISGLGAVRPELAAAQCALCHRAHGAVARCGASHCTAAMHPLCARRHGLYLAARPASHGRTQHLLYCAAHSEAARAKDRDSGGALLLSSAPRQRRPSAAPSGSAGDLVAAGGAAAAAAGVPLALREALEELAEKEIERGALGRARMELENLRLICDQIKKRERLKRLVAQSGPEWLAAVLDAGAAGGAEADAARAAFEAAAAQPEGALGMGRGPGPSVLLYSGLGAAAAAAAAAAAEGQPSLSVAMAAPQQRTPQQPPHPNQQLAADGQPTPQQAAAAGAAGAPRGTPRLTPTPRKGGAAAGPSPRARPSVDSATDFAIAMALQEEEDEEARLAARRPPPPAPPRTTATSSAAGADGMAAAAAVAAAGGAKRRRSETGGPGDGGGGGGDDDGDGEASALGGGKKRRVSGAGGAAAASSAAADESHGGRRRRSGAGGPASPGADDALDDDAAGGRRHGGRAGAKPADGARVRRASRDGGAAAAAPAAGAALPPLAPGMHAAAGGAGLPPLAGPAGSLRRRSSSDGGGGGGGAGARGARTLRVEREVAMTPSEADEANRMLPRGFAYLPSDHPGLLPAASDDAASAGRASASRSGGRRR